MEMAWSHPTETLLYHHQARLGGEREVVLETLETAFVIGRDQAQGQELIPAREECTGQEAMERDC